MNSLDLIEGKYIESVGREVRALSSSVETCMKYINGLIENQREILDRIEQTPAQEGGVKPISPPALWEVVDRMKNVYKDINVSVVNATYIMMCKMMKGE